jgi:hypothetical protein
MWIDYVVDFGQLLSSARLGLLVLFTVPFASGRHW